jgi:hypothetical protein
MAENTIRAAFAPSLRWERMSDPAASRFGERDGISSRED